MRKLLDFQFFERVIFVRFFRLTEHPGNALSPFHSLFLTDTFFHQRLVNLHTHFLGARANVFIKRGLKKLGGAPSPLKALGRNPQPQRATHHGGFRTAEVVAVEVGRRIGGE